MPRSPNTRIDPRVAQDSSQSANVPLQVQARVDHPRGASPAWALASALQSSIGAFGEMQARSDAQQQHLANEVKRQQAERAKAEGDAGQATAQHDAVTGQQTNLQMHSDAFAAAYKQKDGLRFADDFGNALQAKLARLEPGKSSEELQKFIQDDANQFIQDKQIDPTSQQSFFAAVSKATTGWKDQYNKQSIQESLKRDEENLGAIGTAGIKSGSLLTAEGFSGFHDTLLQRGLNETEARKIMATSFAESLASGDIDVKKAQAVLKTPIGSDGVSLSDIPAFKGQLDLAAKRGQAVQDEAHKKAQAEALTNTLYRLSNAADQGLLSDAQISATRRQFDLTPEWAVGMHNRVREAQQKQAKDAEKLQEQQDIYNALLGNDPVQKAAIGMSKLSDAAAKATFQAYKSGDDNATIQTVVALARNNDPNPALKALGEQFDPADIPNAKRMLNVFQAISGQSRDYLEAQLGTKASAQLYRYESLVNNMGMTPDAALQKMAQIKDAVERPLALAQTAAYIKQHASVIPRNFGDSSILSGKFTSTPIQNQAYVNAAVGDIAAELMQSGQLTAEDAVKNAVTRFNATHTRVGDMYVPTPNGTNPQLGKALTEAADGYKHKLVDGSLTGGAKMAEDSTVYFMPAVNDPGKFILMRNDDGVPSAVIRKDKDGTSNFVAVDAQKLLANYSSWSTDKAKQDTVREQALRKAGFSSLVGKSDAELKAAAQQLAMRPNEALGVTGMTFDGKLIADGYTHNKETAAQLTGVLDQTKTPSFVDFLHQYH